MENPWADAWNVEQPDSNQEADLATPSWSTAPGIRWAEPSNFTSLWNNNNNNNPVDPSWSTPKSPYDDIPIGRTPSRSDSPVSEHHATSNFQTAPTTPSSPKPQSLLPDSLPQSPVPVSTPPLATRPTSPDAFGTFESANTDINASACIPSPPSFPSDSLDNNNTWGTVWEPTSDTEPSAASEHPQIDEWEIAKLQKQKRDQHVPPELLASIMQQAAELSSHLWPESPLDEGDTRQPSKDFLSDVPSLAPAVEMFVPDGLVLSPNVQFARTFTAKHMNEALRLTKHLPMTMSSPMAIYMTSKGSTAWEMSVKSKQDIGQDDLLPPGWRMVDKDKQERLPTLETKKKAGGGLLSFLGLKTSDGSMGSAPPKRSPSSSRPASMIGSTKSTRSSLDATSQSSPSQPSTLPADPSVISSVSDPQQLSTKPSAVSRLLTRFSRSSAVSSNQSGSKPHSLALSSNDIEFLSDIVPSANDDANDDENLKSLTTLIAAKSPSSSSATPLPQPLPPPPKSSFPLPPPVPSTFSSSTKNSTDDLFSLFDSPATEEPLTSTESSSIQSLVPLTTKPAVRQTVSAPNSSTLAPRPPAKPLVPVLTPTMAQSSSRAHTPTTVPPAVPQRRCVTAIMLDSGRPSASVLQAPLPPPPLPPPPNLPATSSRPAPPLALLQPPQKQPTSLFDDDDDFSAFMSSRATTPDFPPQSSISSILQTISPSTSNKLINAVLPPPTILDNTFPSIASFSSTLSNHNLLHSSNSGAEGFASSSSATSGLGLLDSDFSDFVSSSPSSFPLPTTSLPPRPPSKPPVSGVALPPPPTLSPSKPLASLSAQTKDGRTLPLPPPTSTRTRHDHSRTASLVESAAARPGRWPAPPSPSPQAVTLPPPPPFAAKNGLDVFGDLAPPPRSQSLLDNSTARPPANKPGLTAPLPLRATSPPLNPININDRGSASSSPWSYGENGSKPLTPTLGAAASSNKAGGLSAQDLSFFEGL